MWKILLVCALTALSNPVASQEFPVRPIRFVTTAVGGPSDAVGRTIANGLSERFRQQVLVDGRSGANGVIGIETVAKAHPDGYTLLVTTGSFAINPSIYKKLPYSPLKDFAPLSLVATSGGLVMVVHPSVPARNVRELIELDKKSPGQITYASAGVGNTLHIAGELFNLMAGTRLYHIPYKSSSMALTDVMGGHVSVMFPGTVIATPNVKSGKVRALGITAITRSNVLPDVPTLDEAGLKGFDLAGWYGMLAPAQTPKRIISYLQENIVAVIKQAQTREALEGWGLTPVGNTPEQFAEFIRKEIEKYAKIVRETGIPTS